MSLNVKTRVGNFTGLIFLTNFKGKTVELPVIELLDHVDRLPLGKAIPMKRAKTLFKKGIVLDNDMYKLLISFLRGLYAVRYDRHSQTVEKLTGSKLLPSHLQSIPGANPTMHLVCDPVPRGYIF